MSEPGKPRLTGFGILCLPELEMPAGKPERVSDNSRIVAEANQILDDGFSAYGSFRGRHAHLERY